MRLYGWSKLIFFDQNPPRPALFQHTVLDLGFIRKWVFLMRACQWLSAMRDACGNDPVGLYKYTDVHGSIHIDFIFRHVSSVRRVLCLQRYNVWPACNWGCLVYTLHIEAIRGRQKSGGNALPQIRRTCSRRVLIQINLYYTLHTHARSVSLCPLCCAPVCEKCRGTDMELIAFNLHDNNDGNGDGTRHAALHCC